MKTPDHILSISELTFSFEKERKHENQYKLFDRLNLCVPAGTVTALTGGNGSGKTTLFNIINGLISGYSGDIHFKGADISGKQPHKIARLGIGRLFQGARVFEELSILENLIVGNNKLVHTELPFYNLLRSKATRTYAEASEKKAIELLNKLFGENNHFILNLHKPASDLSYGQQRLLQLVSLLMGDYELYLLDEPTSGVNPKYIGQIAEILSYMTKVSEKSVFLIEHNMHFVKQVATFCAFIDDGNIIAQGSPKEVLGNETVQLSYLGF